MDGAPQTAENRLLATVGGKERFARSFDSRSHYPDRVAARSLADAVAAYDAGAAAILKAGGDAAMVEDWCARFVKLWAAYQHAGARTVNWFIVGPANFPTQRNEKRMDVERRRGAEFNYHAQGAAEWVRRRLRSAERAERSAEAAQVEHAETPFAGGRLVRNAVLDRIQLVFDGKPSPEIIAELKARAFRWSPREGAWQRQLTRNGIWAAEAVVAAIAGKGAV